MALIKINTRSIPDSAVTPAKVSANLGRRNLIINGAMQVSQRGTDIDDIANDGQPNMDRFRTRDYGGNGTYDYDQSGNVPDSTFTKSLKLTCKSASTNTGSYGYSLEQLIEGYNIVKLRLGRSTAQKITVSFWVKSSLAGTYSTGMRTTSGEYSYVTEFTLSANTWKYVTYTAPALTTTLSSLDETINVGLHIDIVGLGKQTSKTTSTLNAWQAGNYVFSSNQVAWADNANATLNVTGVQVEAGDTATEFEHRSFDEELHACKRYYQKSFVYGTTPANAGNTTSNVYDGNMTGYCGSNNGGIYSGGQPLVPEMRVNPTMTTYGNSNGHWGQMIPTNTGTVSYSAGAGYIANVRTNGFSVGQNISGNVLMIGFGQWTASAEL